MEFIINPESDMVAISPLGECIVRCGEVVIICHDIG